MAAEIVAHHRHRRARRVATHKEAVAAQAAVDLGHHLQASGLDEEAVVALGAVGHHLLDVDVGDVQAGAEDACVGDHEVVGELGADDAHGVEAVATVDAHRRVDHVQDGVGAAVTLHVGARAFAVARALEREGAHGEHVVAVAAVEVQHRDVAEHGELVGAVATVDGGGLADAVGEPAARDFQSGEHVLGGDAGDEFGARVAHALGTEHLPDLSAVGAEAQVDGGGGDNVVEHHIVVASQCVDRQAFDVAVVEALDVVAAVVDEGNEAGVGVGTEHLRLGSVGGSDRRFNVGFKAVGGCKRIPCGAKLVQQCRRNGGAAKGRGDGLGNLLQFAGNQSTVGTEDA